MRPLLAIFILLALAVPAAAQSTVGAIQGVVSDADIHEPLPGVTILISSPSLQGDQTTMTDETGLYQVTDLPPGLYSITAYYLDVTIHRNGVVVSAGKTTPGYVAMKTSNAGAEVITVDSRPPSIDPTQSTQGVTLDQDFVKHLPVGRNYEDNLASAGGASSDDAGVSYSGSSSLENEYVIDGVNTTSLVYGQVGSSLANEFIDETEIITGGYNAEYGRSTGGVINVVTKSGSNHLHGSVFGTLSPGAFAAAVTPTASESASIDSESKLDYQTDFGAEVGGPIWKDRIWFYAGVAPNLSRETISRITRRRVDQNQDGIPDVDPATGFLVYQTLDSRSLASRSHAYQTIGKLDIAVSPEHQGQISLIATPTRADELGVDGLPGATRLVDTGVTSDLSGKWTSKLFDSKTEVEAIVGWHHAAAAQHPLDGKAGNTPRQNLYDGDLGTWGALGGESQATIDGCTDGGTNDPYPLIRNCPDEGNGYAIGGPGALNDATENRASGRLGLTQRVTALGHHEVKAGLDVEDDRLTKMRSTSGDVSFDLTLPHDGLDGQTEVWRYVRLAPPGNPQNLPDTCTDTDAGTAFPCQPLGPTAVVGETLNWASYLRDSWQVRPELTIDLGLRYEEQRLRYAKDLQNTIDPFTGEHRGKNALVLTGMWAPRVGVVYDWTKEGRSKAYVHWGRFFESVPMDLNSVNFGGETTYRQAYAMTQCGDTVAGVGGPDGMGCLKNGQTPELGSNVYGSGSLVAPGIKAQYLDETLAGVEYALTEDLKVGVAFQDRQLGRVVEDVSPDDTQTYVLSNPGEFPADQEHALEQQIAAATDPAERDRLQHELDVYTGIRRYDRPTRRYDALQITAVRRLAHDLFLQGTYTYAHTRGNFPGLYSPEDGAINPNITAQYDLLELLTNLNGPLPNDRPHDLKIDGYYLFALGHRGQLTTGARFRLASGTPIDALAGNAIYGFDESFLLPRGSVGRVPYDYGVDLHLGYQASLGHGMALEVYTDLFNVLDRQAPSTVDQTYTHDNVDPIAGGDARDVLWAKVKDADGNEPDDPRTIQRNPNFRNARTRTDPLMGRLGARLTF